MSGDFLKVQSINSLQSLSIIISRCLTLSIHNKGCEFKYASLFLKTLPPNLIHTFFLLLNIILFFLCKDMTYFFNILFKSPMLGLNDDNDNDNDNRFIIYFGVHNNGELCSSINNVIYENVEEKWPHYRALWNTTRN